MSKIFPWEYTSEEGGAFKIWKFGDVSEDQLKQRSINVVKINGIEVHSLIFEAATSGTYARWDCINGWTTTIEKAKDLWPEGLHGELNKYNNLYNKEETNGQS